MAKVIFASHGAGAVILPLMVFHQIQLMVCAALAQRWGRRAELSAPASTEARSHGGLRSTGVGRPACAGRRLNDLVFVDLKVILGDPRPRHDVPLVAGTDITHAFIGRACSRDRYPRRNSASLRKVLVALLVWC